MNVPGGQWLFVDCREMGLSTMRHLCVGRLLLWVVFLVGIGCTGSSQTASQGPSTFPEQYHRVVRPEISVLDADGAVVANPFFGGFNTPRPQFVDIDGDGDEDLFVQETSNQLSYFEHVAKGDSSALVWRTDEYRDLQVGEWFRFVDLDQDGVTDLLAEEPYSHLRAYRNRGTRTDPRFELFLDTLRTPDGEAIFSDRQNIPNVTDIDCDGQLDLFLGRLDGTMTRYEAAADTAGMPQFAHVTDNFEGIEIVNQKIGVRHGANTLTFADIDRDGDSDLFWGDFFEPGLLLIENTGGCDNPTLRGEPEPFPPSNPLKTSGYNAPALTDWTGNGLLDVFVGVLGGADDANASLADNFYFYEHQSDGYRLRSRQFVGGVDIGSESSVAVGDITGTGRPDLVAANKIDPEHGETSRLYRFLREGSNDSPVYRHSGSVDLPSAYHYAPALGDLTGDEVADLVVGTWKGRIAYYRNDGDGSFHLEDESVVELDGRHASPALADLTGDGRLDLLVGAADGSVRYYRNTGSPVDPSFESESTLLTGQEGHSRSSPAVHDVNGDGLPDLLLGATEGLYVHRNTGTQSQPSFEGDPTPVSLDGILRLATPAVGDLNGNGEVDIVSGTERGGLLLFQPTAGR